MKQYSAVLTAMQAAGAVNRERGLTHNEIQKLSGLTGQQVSNALFNFHQRKAISRETIQPVPGLPKIFKYWYLGEKKQRRVYQRRQVTNGSSNGRGAGRAGVAYKVSITGDSLNLERTVNSVELHTLVGWLIK